MLFEKALAAEGLIVNLLRDVPSLRALWEDGRRLPGDIRLAWAMPDVRPDPDQTLEWNIVEGRLTPAELQEVEDAITAVEREEEGRPDP